MSHPALNSIVADKSLELWAANVRENRFLPARRAEIPVAGSGFVVIAGSIGDRWTAPVIHTHLQQGAVGYFHPRFRGAAFEPAGRQRGTRRGAPEMPDSVGPLANVEDDGVIHGVVGHRHEFGVVARKPGAAKIKSAAKVTHVVVQDDVVSIDAAR